jgi:hypothetical protein
MWISTNQIAEFEKIFRAVLNLRPEGNNTQRIRRQFIAGKSILEGINVSKDHPKRIAGRGLCIHR